MPPGPPFPSGGSPGGVPPGPVSVEAPAVAFIAHVDTSSAAPGENVRAREVYRQYFGKDSGTILLIDMGSRVITIFSDGKIYKTVNTKYGSIITDNVYKYASKGDYYLCATRAFNEEYTLLEGGKIAQPMRHITNAMTAVVLALIGNFMYVWIRKKRISGETLAKTMMILSAADTVSKAPLAKNLVSSRRSHRSSDSGGGSSGGGGGFGGGGSSGGGGSHRF